MEEGDTVKKIGVTISEVYETEDLPEDDQQMLTDLLAQEQQPKSEFIESSRLDVKEAFKLFVNKTIDSTNVDFSDSIAHPKIGYEVSDSSQQPKNETVLEKYERLKQSIAQLSDEVNIIKDKETSDKLNPTEMANRLLYLQKELSRINPATSGDGGDNDPKIAGVDSDAQNHYHRKLMNELDCFLTSSTLLPAPSSSSSSSSSSDALKYNLYSSTGQVKHSFNALVSDLEQRIERCEAALGVNSEKSVFTGENEDNTLLGALSLVVAKFTLLDLSQLSYFDSSLLAIQQKLLQASVKVEASDIADKVDSVMRTYDALKKADPIMDKLPDIIDRFNSLDDVHQSAMQFNKALNHVSESQKILMDHLQDHSEQLKQIQALQGQHMQQFESNCKAIEELST